MDAHAILGIPPGASPQEAADAYRRLAKRWHPDRAGSEGAGRMAQINAAYEAVRGVKPPAAARAVPRRRPPGAWLPEPVRAVLGGELVAALERDEPVRLVTPASTWRSPSTVLAVTDRRLLWLLDDAPTHRVRSLRFRDVEAVEQALAWPRRRHAKLTVQPRYGRRWTFAELRPATAQAIAEAVGAGAPRRRGTS